MDAFQITDALSASFFALLGIWGAVARQHWFLRCAVVGAFLLAAISASAYELVIQFGVQVGVIAAVVWFVRERKSWRPRLSLETALLATVIIAVAAAVASRLPKWEIYDWLRLIGVGVLMAYIGLLCLWVVCGRTSVGRRLVLGAVGIVLFIALLHFGGALESLQKWGASAKPWWVKIGAHYTSPMLSWWGARLLPTAGLGLSIMIVMLSLARASGWFDRKSSEPARPSPWATRPARWTLAGMAVAIVAPLLYILYRLATPAPLPALDLPSPNGYDDFVAAGELTTRDFMPIIRGMSSMRYPQWKSLYDELAPTDELVNRGLKSACLVRDPFAAVTSGENQDWEAVSNADVATGIRAQYLKRYGTTEEYVAACLRALRFEHESTRGGGLDAWRNSNEGGAAMQLQQRLGDLDARACREVARAIAKFEQRREPMEDKRAIQFLIDQHSGWKTHLEKLLTIWSGSDPYALDYFAKWQLSLVRLAAVDSALQAYWLEHGRVPKTLDELTPEYLPEIPIDPFSLEPIRYTPRSEGYVAYCAGWHGDDDRGVPETDVGMDGDIVAKGPHVTPLVERVMRVLYRGEALFWESLAPRKAGP